MNKIAEAARWIAINGFFAVLVWFAVTGSSSALIAVNVISCVMLIAGLLLLTPMGVALMATHTEQKSKLYEFIDFMYDIAIIAILATGGCYLSSIFYAINLAILRTLVVKIDAARIAHQVG